MPYSKLIADAHEDLCNIASKLEHADMTYEDWEEVELMCDTMKKLHEMKHIVKEHVTAAIAGHHTGNPRGRGRM